MTAGSIEKGIATMTPLVTDFLLSEYETIVAEIGTDASDDALIAALVQNGDWTPRGARAIVHLAREYGTAILRNALALAHALDIEDGESRL